MDQGLKDEEKELWLRFKSSQDAEARDRLVRHYSPWATSIARSIHRRVWAYPVDSDDFVQNATIGLLEAMSRFDPERGIVFEAYAKARVRGAVFNGLRAIVGDRLQPQDSRRAQARLELIREAGEEGDALARLLDAVVGLGIGYLIDDSVRLAGMAKPEDAYAYATRNETSRKVLSAMARLPDRYRKIVEDHYFHEVAFIEIASRLGVTKGRVSQIHKAAMAHMREYLAGL